MDVSNKLEASSSLAESSGKPKDGQSSRSASTVGILAGWGQLPVVVARQLKKDGHQVVCCGLRGHADPQLAEICDHFRWVGLAKAQQQLGFFKRHRVTTATMAGKVFKTSLFRKMGWVRHLPDLVTIYYFFPHFISKTKNRNDDALLECVTRVYADYGIRFIPATDIAPELLVNRGYLTQHVPTLNENKDIAFGYALAREMGRLDVGQTVVVKGRAVLAIEALEGTDECIRRAGQLCPAGGFTVVKVAKPQQDMRFDVPTVGIGTLTTLLESGGSVLAVEADRTIMLDQKEMVNFANRHRIRIVAFSAEDIGQILQSA